MIRTALVFLLAAVALVAALAPHLLSSFDPYATAPLAKLTAPNLTHWFGTDELGRDLFTRVVYGARLSVLAASLAGLVVTFSTLRLRDPALLRPALVDAFRKLNPAVQWRNPVMFVVYIGSILTTMLKQQQRVINKLINWGVGNCSNDAAHKPRSLLLMKV